MSQTPNNPFDTQPNQFGHPQQTAQSSGGGKTWLWVLGILAGMFMLCALVCCGFLWYGTNELAKIGGGVIVEQYGDDPVVVEHIGEIKSSKMSISEMASESSKDDDIIALVVEVEGDKGSGTIIQRTDTATDEETAVLIMKDGTEHALTTVADTSEFDEIESAMEGLEEIEAMEENADSESGNLPSGELTPQ